MSNASRKPLCFFLFLLILSECVAQTAPQTGTSTGVPKRQRKDARLSQSFGAFPADETADALGSLIDTVLILGDAVTRKFVIRQELLFTEGDTLTIDNLKSAELRVFSLQLFNTVTVSARRCRPLGDTTRTDTDSMAAPDSLVAAADAVGDRIAARTGRAATVVLLSVNERWYLFPIPLGSLRGVSLTQWIRKPTLSNINIGLSLQHRNFTGSNDRLSLSFGVGFDPFIQLAYNTPYLFGDRLTGVGASLVYQRLNNLALSFTPNTFQNTVPVYQQISLSGSLALTRRLSTFDFLSASASYTAVDVPVEARAASALASVAPSGKDRFLSLGASYAYNNVDFAQYPTRGLYLGASLTQTGLSPSPDEVAYTRGTLDARLYQESRLVPDLTFAVRSFASVAAGRRIPNYLRQFVGLGLKIRGYTAALLEGDNIQFNSIELRYPLLRPQTAKLDFIPVEQFRYLQYGFFITAFVDAGALWYNARNPDVPTELTVLALRNYKLGYGIGLSYIGSYNFTARIDAAFNDRGVFDLVLENSVSF